MTPTSKPWSAGPTPRMSTRRSACGHNTASAATLPTRSVATTPSTAEKSAGRPETDTSARQMSPEGLDGVPTLILASFGTTTGVTPRASLARISKSSPAAAWAAFAGFGLMKQLADGGVRSTRIDRDGNA